MQIHTITITQKLDGEKLYHHLYILKSVYVDLLENYPYMVKCHSLNKAVFYEQRPSEQCDRSYGFLHVRMCDN